MSRTIVIGAGAAGIAAARALHDAGRDVLLLEAGERLGGRARSTTLALPGHGQVTVDLGCGWLHSARRNPWTAIAERDGLTIDRTSPKWDVQWQDLGYPPAEQQAFGEAWDRWETAAHAALDGPDRPLSDFIDAADPACPMIDAISGYANGAPLSRVSLHDWAAYEDAATGDNWAVREGYGTLIVRHARDVPHRLCTPVSRIDHRGRQIRVDTPSGTVTADQLVVAVSPTVLAGGGITFDPPLSAKQDAAAALPLGLADKVFLAVDRPIWPPHSHLIGNPHTQRTASYRLSPFGWPLIEVFLGGDTAESLEGDGDAAGFAIDELVALIEVFLGGDTAESLEGDGDAAGFAIDELVALLGADWRARLHPLATTRWRQEPWIGGSYSHARVGQAGARLTLAEPVDDRIFFAGEACSPTDFSTAHGAHATGMAAANAILRRP